MNPNTLVLVKAISAQTIPMLRQAMGAQIEVLETLDPSFMGQLESALVALEEDCGKLAETHYTAEQIALSAQLYSDPTFPQRQLAFMADYQRALTETLEAIQQPV